MIHLYFHFFPSSCQNLCEHVLYIIALMGIQTFLDLSSDFIQSIKSSRDQQQHKTNIGYGDSLDAKHHLFPLAISEHKASSGLTLNP